MEMRHEIKKLAYELFEKNGRIHGHELEHWIEAERIVCSRHASAGNGKDVMAQKSVASKSPAKKSTVKTAGKSSKTGTDAPKTGVSGKAASAGRSKKVT